jgi:uncharacterized protein with HEPN domain
MASQLEIDRNALSDFCERHRIRRLALFGSVLRDDFKRSSGVDVLVEFEPEQVPGLIRFWRDRARAQRAARSPARGSHYIQGPQSLRPAIASWLRRTDLRKVMIVSTCATCATTRKKACDLIAGKSRPPFDADEVLRLALSYLVQIIGKAATHVSQDRRQAYPEIPWQDIVGMRHRPVRGYFEVDQDIVWQPSRRSLDRSQQHSITYSILCPTGTKLPSDAAGAGGFRSPRG